MCTQIVLIHNCTMSGWSTVRPSHMLAGQSSEHILNSLFFLLFLLLLLLRKSEMESLARFDVRVETREFGGVVRVDK